MLKSLPCFDKKIQNRRPQPYQRVSSPHKTDLCSFQKGNLPLSSRYGKWIKKRTRWSFHVRPTSIAWYGFSDQSLEGVERHTSRRGADLFRNRTPDRTPQLGARRSKCMRQKPVHSRSALPSSGSNRRGLGRLQRPRWRGDKTKPSHRRRRFIPSNRCLRVPAPSAKQN